MGQCICLLKSIFTCAIIDAITGFPHRKTGMAMIITKTPFRMSFFGGGTDLPQFFREHGGAVISSSFDKYCYVTVRHLPPFFDYRTELSYSLTERVTTTEDIRHPAIREAMRYLDMHDLRLTYEADLPARTGLGTSSSFAVGMLNAFHALKGTCAGKRQLSDEAIFLERELCREAGGWQDQIAAAFGGLNRIDFLPGGSYEVQPIAISPRRKQALNDRLMLFFTGFTRFSSEIQQSTTATMQDKTRQLLDMLALVEDAQEILINSQANLDDFGRLLDLSWRLKRQTGSKISTDSIDALYEKALSAGAIGGKLLGAGGGGFLLFYVPVERQPSVEQALNGLMKVPFRFEDDGTQIIHNSPELYIPRGSSL